ncbi:Tn3 family transposase [Streptomyces sp. NPDC050448]|uniref:Tn3 family transposase n=1 Tax=Streptomyces sp. NPDC050448 TaxID=3155404 RepID=UPI003449741B
MPEVPAGCDLHDRRVGVGDGLGEASGPVPTHQPDPGSPAAALLLNRPGPRRPRRPPPAEPECGAGIAYSAPRPARRRWPCRKQDSRSTSVAPISRSRPSGRDDGLGAIAVAGVPDTLARRAGRPSPRAPPPVRRAAGARIHRHRRIPPHDRQAAEHHEAHRLARQISFGRRGEPRQSHREGVEYRLGALAVALNAVVLWHSLYLDRAAERLAADGFPVTDDLLARLSPPRFDHSNFLGCYAFFHLREAGRRPLREPSAGDDASEKQAG